MDALARTAQRLHRTKRLRDLRQKIDGVKEGVARLQQIYGERSQNSNGRRKAHHYDDTIPVEEYTVGSLGKVYRCDQ